MLAEMRYSIATYPWLYALWAAVALSWLVAGGIGLARLARARPRIKVKGAPGASGRRLLRDGLAQVAIWRKPLAGAMHLGLFLGGTILLVAFVASHFWAPRGDAWNKHTWIHTVEDWAVLLMLVGVALAGWRRHAKHELAASAEDVLLWVMVLLAVLLTLIGNVLVVAMADPDWKRRAFLSLALARPMADAPAVTLRGLYGCVWSALHVLVWGMAIAFPWCKWRHVLLAPLSLATARPAPLAAMSALSLEGDGPYGARTLRDLTRKERLDLAACTRCTRCTLACPAHGAGRKLDPMALLEAIGGARKSPLLEGYDEVVLWDCTTCMACDEVCPVGISPLSLILDLRRERVLDAAAFPHSLQETFVSMERRGNPWHLPRGGRHAAADELGLRVLPPGDECEVLLWLGCMGAYDAASRPAVRALVRLLRAAGVDVAVLGADESCCGDTARRGGNERLWRELAAANIEALGARRFERIISLCPHGVNTLANEYPCLENSALYRAQHASAYLAELLREGRLTLSAEDEANVSIRVAYHDPCYLGRGIGGYAAPRDLIATLPGVKLVELAHHGRDSLCCGAGGGQMWLDTPNQALLAAPRANEIMTAEVDACVTACPYCATMLSDQLRADAGASNRNGSDTPVSAVVVRDLVELLAEAIAPAASHRRIPEEQQP